MRYSKQLVKLALVLSVVAVLAAPATAGRPGFVFPGGCCYYEGQIVRTVVPPAAFPNTGTDPFYAIIGGVSQQKAVVGLVPGDAGYNGGHWAFNAVTWNTSPYLLTSEDDVLDAADAGDVTVTPNPAMDFLCPIQPGK